MFSPEGLANFCSGSAETGFRLVYNIELYFRHMVRWELVGAHGERWTSVLGELGKEARRRQTQEAEMRLIDSNPRNLLDYLLLTEIKDVMVFDSVWPLFKHRWPPQDMLLAEFKLFNALRHKVAHFRAPTDRDLRMLDRFKDMLIDISSWYRQQRRSVKKLDPLMIEIEGVAPSMQATLAQWATDCAADVGRWRSLHVSRVGKYVALNAQMRAGSFAPGSPTRLINKSGCDAFFLCLDEAEGLLRVYVPIALGEEAASRLLPLLYAYPTIGEMPENDDDLFVERFDFVMPYHVELPMDFRV